MATEYLISLDNKRIVYVGAEVTRIRGDYMVRQSHGPVGFAGRRIARFFPPAAGKKGGMWM